MLLSPVTATITKTNQMKTMTYDNPRVDCYVDENAGSAEDCNSRTIDFAKGYGFTYEPLPSDEDEDYSQILSETADEAIEFLNEQETRTGMYWTFKDNSLFLTVDVDSVCEDIDFVSSKTQDYPDLDYRGEWLHISDHGNATLYCRGEDAKDVEIWSIV